jgi:hypothetical protein
MGLAGEYVDVDSDEDRPLVLQLRDDGTFIFVRGPRAVGVVAPEPESIAEGRWEVIGGELEITAGGWRATFVPDSTWVTIPRGAAMLPSLRWVTSTEGSPFSAGHLVSREHFEELLHPSEGSGSSGL